MTQSVRELLEQKAAEVEAQITNLRAQIEAFESELGAAHVALAALGPAINASGRVTALPARGYAATDPLKRQANIDTPYGIRAMTMKQLVRQALSKQFPEGATSAQMLDYFHKKLSRPDIVRSSLSPQLSRMKSDDEIERNGQIWSLARDKDLEIIGFSDNENGAPKGAPEARSDANPIQPSTPNPIPD